MNHMPLSVHLFPISYRQRMIGAYPVIAGITQEQVYGATKGQLDQAFARVLAAKNLQMTHRLYLERHRPWPGFCQACGAPLDPPAAISCRSCGRSDVDE